MAGKKSWDVVPGPTFMHGGGYGQPGTWKSRTFTSFPPEWGKVLYIGVDEHARGMSSTLASHRGNVILKVPPLEVPSAELYEACMRNWKEDYPDIGVLVIDTLTEWARHILQENAKKRQYSSKPIAVPLGGGEEIVIPAQGDYLPTHATVDTAITYLIRQPYHTFVICHAGFETVDEGGIERHMGGPLTVGKAAIGSLGGRLNPLFYFSRKDSLTGGAKCRIHTEKVGIWQAKVASPHAGNPHPVIEIGPDPAEAWRLIKRVYIDGEEK